MPDTNPLASVVPSETPQAPVQDTAAPAAQPLSQSAPEAAQQQFDLLGFAQQHGFDTTGFEKPDDFAARLISDYQQAQAVAAWAQQNVQPRQEPAPQPPPKEEEWSLDGHLKKHWGLPQFDPAWQEAIASGAIVKDPDTGQYVPRPGASWMTVNPAVLQQINTWQSGYEKNVRDFLQDPYRKIIGVVQDVFDRRYAKPEVLDQRFEAQQTNDYLSAAEDRMSPYLYKDQSARFRNDDPRFTANLTDYGRQFFKTFNVVAGIPGLTGQQILEQVLDLAPVPAAGGGVSVSPPPAAAAPSPQPQTSFLGDSLAKAEHRASGQMPPAQQHAGSVVVSSTQLKDLIRAA